MKKITLTLSSDFRQIQVFDGEFDPLDGDDDLEWDAEAVKRFGCYCPQLVALGVIENQSHILPVRTHTSDCDPELAKWDHVVEFPFECLSGLVDIGSELVRLPIGKYQLRWSVRKVSLHSGEYQLDFIRSDRQAMRVLKQLAE
ncbi:hypothetical protein [Marinobacter zhejiangensis]|uniref:Competence protein J (ComJ) n=1 Tax=Marinobacter zhejiangensis TaxID=488535 RepID=A0A1I4RDZ4_9GAMM|nr:hypothetical protein [Marinobacter zhejiangensis]SFM50494.1 hypothetical protein SAMN04487963_2709 [Marinobacter zhejiangensis]